MSRRNDSATNSVESETGLAYRFRNGVTSRICDKERRLLSLSTLVWVEKEEAVSEEEEVQKGDPCALPVCMIGGRYQGGKRFALLEIYISRTQKQSIIPQ